MFILNKDIDFASYADDTTPFICGQTFEEIIYELETVMADISNWFLENNLKANEGKYHLLLSPFIEKTIQVGDFAIASCSSEKILGVTIDCNLTFKEHVLYLCSNANKKLHAMARISKYMSLKKRRILINSFIISQFSYCPLIWMIHNRGLNNKINHIHERALRIVYKDYSSSFKELLAKDKSVTIHQRNLRQLAIEIFKVKMGLSPVIMKEVFDFCENKHYDLRSGIHLSRIKHHSTHYGTDSLSNLGAKIWDLLPNDIKELNTLSSFKAKIKKWIPEKCPCRLCKNYIAQVGFI